MLDNGALILGAGISGMTCALALASQDIHVYLVEREKEIGGLVASFSCKATDRCNNCGICLLNEKIRAIGDTELITLFTSCRIKEVEGEFNHFDIQLVQGGGPISVKAKTIVAATGADVFDAREKKQFGYKRYKDVITGLDLEERLRTGSFHCNFNGNTPRNIAFIQCVGSRDENINHAYCSKVCCKYAIRMAAVLRHLIPYLNVTIFYMDLQTTGKDFSPRCEEGIEWINAIPAGIEEGNKLKVRYEDMEKGEILYRDFDLVVLSTGLQPGKENKRLARILKLNMDDFGFLETRNLVETNIEGIYACGTSTSPKSIVDSISSAYVAANRIIRHIGGPIHA
ncbi:MAG: FAD-dependent oxidoreductase [bacterium]